MDIQLARDRFQRQQAVVQLGNDAVASQLQLETVRQQGNQNQILGHGMLANYEQNEDRHGDAMEEQRLDREQREEAQHAREEQQRLAREQREREQRARDEQQRLDREQRDRERLADEERHNLETERCLCAESIAWNNYVSCFVLTVSTRSAGIFLQYASIS